jgi:hypothetical protein
VNYFLLGSDPSATHTIAVQVTENDVDRYGTTAGAAKVVVDQTYDSFFLLTFQISASPALYVNGSSTAGGGNTSFGRASGTASKIGIRTDGAAPMKGDIAEILLYNSALSAGDISDVHTYLLDKYGL